jgi:hypothetical protein
VSDDPLLASAMRKLLTHAGTYVEVWIARTDEGSDITVDGGAALTVQEAEACERVREEWRRVQG